jgi:DNA-directed RNA polymerase specialized sigma24 family protein
MPAMSEPITTIRAVLRDELARAAEDLRRAEAELEDARRRLRVVILRAHEAGLRMSVITEATGRPRQTIHRDLERAREERGA